MRPLSLMIRAIGAGIVAFGALFHPSPASSSCTKYGDYLHRVGHGTTGGYAQGTAISGDRAYVVNKNLGGLDIIDVANAASPAVIGHLSLPEAETVVVAGSHAYVAAVTGLIVIDVDDPSQPKVVGVVPMSAPARGVAIGGRSWEDTGDGFAFVAADTAGLYVVDISQPTNPRIVGGVKLADAALGVAIRGSVIYVAAGGLKVIDIVDPETPRLVSSVHIETPNTIAIRNSDLYLADGPRGFAFLPSRCPHSEMSGIDDAEQTTPPGLAVVPNPARDSAVVRFTPRAAGEVNFAIYDVLGRRIRTLYAGRIDAALQEFAWDGRDDGGRDVHSGVYLARIETTEGTRSARIVMLK